MLARRALLRALPLLIAPAALSAAPIEAVRLGRGFDAKALSQALPRFAALEPSLAARVEDKARLLLSQGEVLAAADDRHLALLPLAPSRVSKAVVVPLAPGEEMRTVRAAGELASRLRDYRESRDDAAAREALERIFDAARRAPPLAPVPFPDLAGSMARSLGIERPARPPLKPLPPLPDPRSLPRDALGTLLMRMANRQNWGDVAYAASNIRTVEGKIRAQWMHEDSKAEVREYFGLLTEEQRRIAEAAFAGGLAETPLLSRIPDPVTLDWVLANHPPRRRP